MCGIKDLSFETIKTIQTNGNSEEEFKKLISEYPDDLVEINNDEIVISKII